MEEVELCPVCASASFDAHITCIDYALSKESFALKRCTVCGLAVTSPRPSAQELGRYYQFPAYISHSGKSDSGIISRLYKVARYATLRWKRKIIETHTPSGQILDVGCGTGEFLHVMKRSGWKIAGVEPAPDARAKAAHLVGQQIFASVDQVPEKTFDVITLWHVLEHIPNLQPALHQLRQVLKPGGIVLIAVPNHASHDAQKYGVYWAGYDVPRHLWHFTSKNMHKLFENNQLIPIKTLPMKLDAYYASLLSEQYLHPGQTIWNLLRAMRTGIVSNLKARQKLNYSSLIFLARATQN